MIKRCQIGLSELPSYYDSRLTFNQQSIKFNHMRIAIESTYPPALYELPGGLLSVTAGTITRLFNKPYTSPVVPSNTILSDFDWTPARDKATSPAALAYSFQVAGSKPNTSYTVSVTATGRSCTCAGFGWRRRCKHILKNA